MIIYTCKLTTLVYARMIEDIPLWNQLVVDYCVRQIARLSTMKDDSGKVDKTDRAMKKYDTLITQIRNLSPSDLYSKHSLGSFFQTTKQQQQQPSVCLSLLEFANLNKHEPLKHMLNYEIQKLNQPTQAVTKRVSIESTLGTGRGDEFEKHLRKNKISSRELEANLEHLVLESSSAQKHKTEAVISILNRTNFRNGLLYDAVMAGKCVTRIINLLHVRSSVHELIRTVCASAFLDDLKSLEHLAYMGKQEEPYMNEALCMAAEQGADKAVTYLIGHSNIKHHAFDLEYKSKICLGRGTALALACANGHLETARQFINARANVNDNSSQFNETPLHRAVKSGNVEIVQLLLIQREIDVNAETERGKTPLQFAIKAQKLEMVQALLGHSKIDLVNDDDQMWLKKKIQKTNRNDDPSALANLKAIQGELESAFGQ